MGNIIRKWIRIIEAQYPKYMYSGGMSFALVGESLNTIMEIAEKSVFDALKELKVLKKYIEKHPEINQFQKNEYLAQFKTVQKQLQDLRAQRGY